MSLNQNRTLRGITFKHNQKGDFAFLPRLKAGVSCEDFEMNGERIAGRMVILPNTDGLLAPYIIMKASRYPGTGRATSHDAYRGESCDDAGVIKGRVYDDFQSAYTDCKRLDAVNPVGFNVWQVGDSAPVF